MQKSYWGGEMSPIWPHLCTHVCECCGALSGFKKIFSSWKEQACRPKDMCFQIKICAVPHDGKKRNIIKWRSRTKYKRARACRWLLWAFSTSLKRQVINLLAHSNRLADWPRTPIRSVKAGRQFSVTKRRERGRPLENFHFRHTLSGQQEEPEAPDAPVARGTLEPKSPHSNPQLEILTACSTDISHRNVRKRKCRRERA